MGIFRHDNIDLSDEGLAAAAEINEDAKEESAVGKGLLDAETEEQQNTGMPAAASRQADANDRENDEMPIKWRQAAEKIAAAWPQAKGQGKELIARMTEISRRYGDPQLWQREPEGLLREAAIELFGMPLTRDNNYALEAAEAARKAAISDLERREQSKLGLAKRKSNIAPPQKPSYEQQIWNEIAAARDSSIF